MYTYEDMQLLQQRLSGVVSRVLNSPLAFSLVKAHFIIITSTSSCNQEVLMLGIEQKTVLFASSELPDE